MIELRFLRPVQYQPHPAASEKRPPGRRLEKQLQPQLVLVEGRRAVHVFWVDGHLTQKCDSNSGCSSAHRWTSRAIVVPAPVTLFVFRNSASSGLQLLPGVLLSAARSSPPNMFGRDFHQAPGSSYATA